MTLERSSMRVRKLCTGSPPGGLSGLRLLHRRGALAPRRLSVITAPRGLAHVPFRVPGLRAREHMSADVILGGDADRSDPENGLGTLHGGMALAGLDSGIGRDVLKAGADDTDPVEAGLLIDPVLKTAPGQGGVGDGDVEVLLDILVDPSPLGCLASEKRDDHPPGSARGIAGTGVTKGAGSRNRSRTLPRRRATGLS